MTDRFLQDVATNLSFQIAWVEIGRYFLRVRPSGKEAPFIHRMLETKQAMINQLSRTLRQQGYAPAQLLPDPKLLEQARKRRTPEAILRYIHHGLLMSVEWYQDRLQNRDHPFYELWQSLYNMELSLKEDIEQVLTS